MDNGRRGWARQSLRPPSRYHSLTPVGPEWDATYLRVPTDNVDHSDPAPPPNGNITISLEVCDFNILGALTVTMTPILFDKYRSSRTLGVRFPFGHSFGAVDEQWPGDAREAYKNWQPNEPSPIVLRSMEMIRLARTRTKPQS
jgi:hypothetical protein